MKMEESLLIKQERGHLLEEIKALRAERDALKS
jgi:hypothetical protein